MASRMFAWASERVLPWEMHPGWQFTGRQHLTNLAARFFPAPRKMERENHSPTQRSPITLRRSPGAYLPRYDTRASRGSLYHEPPRSALYWPLASPDGSLCAPG